MIILSYLIFGKDLLNEGTGEPRFAEWKATL